MTSPSTASDHLDPAELAAWLHSGPGASCAARVRAHMADCAECRGEAIDVAQLLAAAERPVRWRRRTVALLALAAALILTVRTAIERAPESRQRGRSESPASSALTPLTPLGTTTQGVPITFAWRSLPHVVEYRITLLDARGDVLWKQAATDTTLIMPVEISLLRGVPYFWYLDALRGDGTSATSGAKEFRITP